MEVNVSQLLKSAVGTRREYEVDEDVQGIEDAESWNRVHGKVKLLRTRAGILVRADLETVVGCTCSRCLETAQCKLDLDIEEEFFPTIDVSTGFPLEVPAESTDFTISQNHILSLDEAIRQYAVLNRPMQPLCRPDCAGLCPECGADLNAERCDCHLDTSGNPFADLKGIMETGDRPLANEERS